MSKGATKWTTAIGIEDIEYEEEITAEEGPGRVRYNRRQYKSQAATAISNAAHRQYEWENHIRSREGPYREQCRIGTTIGDYEINHTWYYSSADSVDGLERTTVQRKIVDLTNIQYTDYYKAKVYGLNQVEKDLTNGVKTREYGRVFFDKEIRYVLKGEVTLPTIKTEPVKGYCTVGNKRIFGKYIRLPRKEVYKHKGTGILKELSNSGILCERLQQRIKFLKSFQGREYREHQACGAIFFEELRKHHFDFEAWLKGSVSERVESNEDKRARIEKKYNYDLLWVQFSTDIDRLDRDTRRKVRAINTIFRGWRAYFLRTLGTKRTIIGKLGRGTKRVLT